MMMMIILVLTSSDQDVTFPRSRQLSITAMGCFVVLFLSFSFDVACETKLALVSF